MAYKDRIFGIPVISLSDPQWAVEEVEWCIKQGAKAISLRNGPVYTKLAPRRPAHRNTIRSGHGCRKPTSSWHRMPVMTVTTSSANLGTVGRLLRF